jgi:hypothetical protein
LVKIIREMKAKGEPPQAIANAIAKRLGVEVDFIDISKVNSQV